MRWGVWTGEGVGVGEGERGSRGWHLVRCVIVLATGLIALYMWFDGWH